MRICIVVSVVLMGLFSPAAVARDTARSATCAQHAGHPWEPGMAGRGVAWGEIADTDQAILVCRQALEEQPAEPTIQFRLARTLMQVERYDEAIPLLRLSAEAGYSPAETALGTAYLTGIGAEKDNREAEKWLKRAAAQGHPIAQTNLGSMYSSIGFGGLPRDEREAMRLHRLGADQGYSLAQSNLAKHYRYGIGTEFNLAEANRLFELSAAQGDPEGQSQLGELLMRAPPELRDIPRAIEMLAKAALKHNTLAHYELGIAYSNGVGVMRDPFAARAHLERAEAGGVPEALYYLSALYDDDHGVGRDDATAFAYRLRAAEAGILQAMYLVGLAYDRGTGVEKDAALAERWLNRAAALGNPEAQYRIAMIWLDSKRADVRTKALEYAESAGRAGLGAAYILLADHYISLSQWESALGYATLALDVPGNEEEARWRIDQIMPKLDRAKRWTIGPSTA